MLESLHGLGLRKEDALKSEEWKEKKTDARVLVTEAITLFREEIKNK